MNTGPHQLSQDTAKQDMTRVLQVITQGATIGPGTIPLADLVSCRQSFSDGLPHKDFDLRWHPSKLNGFELIRGTSRNETGI